MTRGDSEAYVRVLAVDSAPFNRRGNNGIVKSNFFQGWPKNCLAQIDLSRTPPDYDVCDRYWRVTEADAVRQLLSGRMLPRSGLDGSVVQGLQQGAPPPSSFVRRGLRRLAPGLRDFIWEGLLRLPSVLSPALLRWVDEFSPQVVYTIGGTGGILRMAVAVAEHCRVPMLPYFTDDWLGTLYHHHPLSGLLRTSMLRWLGACLARSPVRLTPTDAMTEEYTRRYGGTFQTLVYAEEARPVPQRSMTSDVSRPVVFAYLGGLEPGRWLPLREIGEALLELRRAGTLGELIVHTTNPQPYGRRLTLPPVMWLGEPLSAKGVRHAQETADVLVHVESFAETDRKYTRFSLSTKIPQYMMAGGCILAYGPGEVASMRYIADGGFGLVVPERNRAALCMALTKLITDPELRARYREQAREAGIANHEANRQREKFRQAVLAAHRGWRQCALVAQR